MLSDGEPEPIPEVEEIYVETGKTSSHPLAEDLLDAPPWKSPARIAPPPAPRLLARSTFTPTSPILRVPKQVVTHLKVTRKGHLSFYAQPDGSVVVRRG